MKIELKNYPEMTLAHSKIIGRFDEISTAYNKLFSWAGEKGLITPPETRVMTIYHKSPEETGPEKVEQSACISIPDGTDVNGSIEKMFFPGGTYAVGSFEITSDEFADSWDKVCNWAVKQGYELKKEYPFEQYYNNHEEHPEKKHIVDICVGITN